MWTAGDIGRSRLSVHTALHGFLLPRIWQTTLSPCLTTYIFPPSHPAGIQRWCQYRAGDRMQIPGAAENAHLYQRQRLTGRAAHASLYLAAQMLHSILNLLLPVLKCSFSSASASSGSSAVSALSTPKVSLPFQKNFSVSATSAVCANKERQRHFVSNFPRIPAEQKRSLTFLPG